MFGMQSNLDSQHPLDDTLRRVQIDPDGVSCIYGSVFWSRLCGTRNHCLMVRPQIEHSGKSSALGGDDLISHSLRTRRCISQTADLLLFLHHHNHLWDLQRMLPKKKKERKRKVLHSLQVFCEPEGFFMAIVTDTHTQVWVKTHHRYICCFLYTQW